MKANKSQRSRLARNIFLGLTGAACVGLVLLAQNPQPQIDKLPALGTGTPNFGSIVPMPAGAALKVPAGFTVSVYADQIPAARYMTYAPNGDLFVSSYAQSTITVLRDANNDGVPEMRSVFAMGAAPAARGGGGAGGGGGAPRGGGGRGGGVPGGAPAG